MTEVAFKRLPLDNPRITGGFKADYGYEHRGIDFGAKEGTPIYAPADGISCWFLNSDTYYRGQPVKSFGDAVCLDHGADKVYRYTIYAHMSKRRVEIGDTVHAGDLLGYVGHTGVADGNHLHWQLCKLDTFPVQIEYSADPLLFMEADMTRDETIALIKELQDTGALASTTDVLSCVAQIVGAEESTYSDTEKIDKVRAAIKSLAALTPTPRVTTTAAKDKA